MIDAICSHAAPFIHSSELDLKLFCHLLVTWVTLSSKYERCTGMVFPFGITVGTG